MKPLPKEYTVLFNGITDALEELDSLRQRLEELQVAAEAIVVEAPEAEEEPLVYLPPDGCVAAGE